MIPMILVTKLSKTFNAEAADVKAVLNKYNAHLGQIGIRGPKLDVVRGVAEKDEAAFIREFKALSGVQDAYKQPMPCTFF